MYSAVTGCIVSLTTILRMSAEVEAAKNETRVPRTTVSRGSFMAMVARDSRSGHRATFIVQSYAPTGLTQLTVSTHGLRRGLYSCAFATGRLVLEFDNVPAP